MLEKIGGRKVILGILVMAIGVIVDMTAGLSRNLLELLQYVGVGFFLSNSIVHTARSVMNGKGGVKDPLNDQTKEAMEGFSKRLDSMDKSLSGISNATGVTQQGVSAILEIASPKQPKR